MGCNTEQETITFDELGNSIKVKLMPDNSNDKYNQPINNGTFYDINETQKIGTILDFDEKGILLSSNTGDALWLIDDFDENLVDMQTMLPFYRNSTVFNTDGTITNYWNSEDSFTIEDGAIEIISQYGGKQHMQIAYETGSYYVIKSTMLSEASTYDSYAALNPYGYTSWYEYLDASDGKINQYDTAGLYDTSTMKVLRGDLDCQGDNCEQLNSSMIIDQNNTRLYVKSCDPFMGGTREETYTLISK